MVFNAFRIHLFSTIKTLPSCWLEFRDFLVTESQRWLKFRDFFLSVENNKKEERNIKSIFFFFFTDRKIGNNLTDPKYSILKWVGVEPIITYFFYIFFYFLFLDWWNYYRSFYQSKKSDSFSFAHFFSIKNLLNYDRSDYLKALRSKNSLI